MFSGVSFISLELWEILNDPLHILNALELSLTLLILQELIDKVMDVPSHISEIPIHDLFEESVILRAQYNLLHILSQGIYMLKVHSVVFNTKQLMNHSLVSPLVK